MIRLDADALLDACIEEASRLADAPMAMVSLVMRHVQLFRAQRGLPPELALSCATSRQSSFCQFVVRDDRPLVIEDAAHDARLPQDLVEQYGVQAYVGVPIRIGGQTIGAMCVVDGRPRHFDPALVAALEGLSAKVADRLAALADKVPPSGPSTAKAERLRRIHRTTELLVGALLAIGPILRHARAAEVDGGLKLDAELREELSIAVLCHADLVVGAQQLAAEVSRLEGGTSDPGLDALRAEVNTFRRELDEVAPLARLARGAISNAISVEGAVKAMSVTRQALDFHRNALAAAQRILDLTRELADAAPSEPAPSVEGGAP